MGALAHCHLHDRDWHDALQLWEEQRRRQLARTVTASADSDDAADAVDNARACAAVLEELLATQRGASEAL